MISTVRRGNALLTALGAFLAFRLGMEIVGLLAAYRGHVVSHLVVDPFAAFRIWRQWDVAWFSNIATHGYPAMSHVLGDRGAYFDGTAFPPAMPVLMASARAAGIDAAAGGLLFSALFLVAALALLFMLVRLDHDEEIARWTILLLLSYPFALFLGTGYAEALVLLATVAAWLAVRRGHWGLAGLAVGIALLAKIVFIVLLVPLTLEILAWDGGRGLRLDRVTVLRVASLWVPALAALAAWMGYLALELHDPFRFLAAQRGWGRAIGLPFGQVADIVRPRVRAGVRLANTLDTAALVGLFSMTVYVYRRVRPTYAVLLGLMGAIFLFNTSLQSNARHLGILFPVFLGLAVMTRERRNARVALLVVQLPIAVVVVARFATGQWAG